ncbi:hypothetical protein TNCV_2220571 [Trichonephila clavipes]|nr:hypothetical protein TNCV_2220571 [Trichonephila clavipes]
MDDMIRANWRITMDGVAEELRIGNQRTQKVQSPDFFLGGFSSLSSGKKSNGERSGDRSSYRIMPQLTLIIKEKGTLTIQQDLNGPSPITLEKTDMLSDGPYWKVQSHNGPCVRKRIFSKKTRALENSLTT